MATMANWNGHTFEVSADLIRCFEDLTIKGACETEDKKKNKQGYVKRKKGQPREITIRLPLSALLGVTDVEAEALAYVNEANNGAKAYFYIGTKKLIKAKLMLISAEISEVVTMPGVGNQWISCVVKMTFKQSTKANEKGSSSSKKKKSAKSSKSTKSSKSKSSSGGGSGGGSKSGSSSGKGKIKGAAGSAAAKVSSAKKDAKNTIKTAKAASKDKIKRTTASTSGLKYYTNIAKKTKETKNTDTKKSATTGRSFVRSVIAYVKENK